MFSTFPQVQMTISYVCNTFSMPVSLGTPILDSPLLNRLAAALGEEGRRAAARAEWSGGDQMAQQRLGGAAADPVLCSWVYHSSSLLPTEPWQRSAWSAAAFVGALGDQPIWRSAFVTVSMGRGNGTVGSEGENSSENGRTHNPDFKKIKEIQAECLNEWCLTT